MVIAGETSFSAYLDIGSHTDKQSSSSTPVAAAANIPAVVTPKVLIPTILDDSVDLSVREADNSRTRQDPESEEDNTEVGPPLPSPKKSKNVAIYAKICHSFFTG